MTPATDALILRTPHETRDGRQFTTTVLSRGQWDETQERWRVADKRLRRAITAGRYPEGSYVAVRSIHDPMVPAVHVQRADARLAVLKGDTVWLTIYGNDYIGTVTDIGRGALQIRAAFSTRTDRRERPFPLLPELHSRGVSQVR